VAGPATPDPAPPGPTPDAAPPGPVILVSSAAGATASPPAVVTRDLGKRFKGVTALRHLD
jgi:hypothetical protein